MKWGAFTVETSIDPDWFEYPADLRGHHQALLARCSQLENGGRIEDCEKWSDRRWYHFAGVSRRLLKRLADPRTRSARRLEPLVTWVGASLIVSRYDQTLEDKVRGGREQRRNAAKSRWSRHAAAYATADATAHATADATAHAAVMRPSPSGSGSPRGEARASDSDPFRGGDPGGVAGAAGSEGKRAPNGAGEAETEAERETEGGDLEGPEGFERWWRLFCSLRPCKAYWKLACLELWVDGCLEAQTDEIIEFCRWSHRHEAHWKQFNADGDSLAPTPRGLLRKSRWKKRGPWNTPTATKGQPTKPAGRRGVPMTFLEAAAAVAPPPPAPPDSSGPTVVEVGAGEECGTELDALEARIQAAPAPSREAQRVQASWAEAPPLQRGRRATDGNGKPPS